MRMGKVIGNVTLGVSDPAYHAGRWLVVSPLSREQLAGAGGDRISKEPSLVVFDNLGSGRGDWVAFVEGAEATAPFSFPIPIDAYNVAILERVNYHPPQNRQAI